MKHLPWHSDCTHGVVVPRPALKYQNKLHAASGHKLHTGPSNHHPSIQKQQSSIITEGTIEVCKIPQNRTKPKTASKIRDETHAVEVVEAQIFRRETGKTPNCIEWWIRKSDFIFCRKPKTESEIYQKPPFASHQNRKTEVFWYTNRKWPKPLNWMWAIGVQ